jgi:thymidine kinase
MFPQPPEDQNRKRGRIEVICGSMFSGKTEELIRRMRRAQFARQKVEIFKPRIDTRYSDDEVVSHDRNAIPSTPVPHSSQLLLMTSDVDVIGIDEAQFFDDELPNVCTQLANSGIRVIVAGLDLDFRGKPFGSMPQLLALAEYVTKVHAICVKTGDLAHHSFKLSKSDRLVELGEKDLYVPLSREAFIRAQNDPDYITEEDLVAIRNAVSSSDTEETSGDTLDL